MLSEEERRELQHKRIVERRKMDYWTRKIFECAKQSNSYTPKIKLTFKEPTHIPKGFGRHSKEPKLSWTFSFFVKGNHVYYTAKRNGTYGRSIDPRVLLITQKVELISVSYAFDSFKQFKAKFDTRFISEQEIIGLWNKESNQTGKRYDKRDFRKMGSRGLQVMKDFCEKYHNLYTKTEHYTPSDYPSSTHDYILTAHYTSWHHKGRDITIEHRIGSPYIYYSSEFHNCGNGSYYLIANKREVLHLEND